MYFAVFEYNILSFDNYILASRSVLSKYNVLPSKDELSRKSELSENIKKTNGDNPSMNLNYNTGKDNLRKIDITLTESSDRSESTSSEIQTDNLNSDYEGAGNIFQISIIKFELI